MPEIGMLLPQARGDDRDFNAYIRTLSVIRGKISQGARLEVPEKSARQLVHHIADKTFFTAAAIKAAAPRFKGPAEQFKNGIKRRFGWYAVEPVASAWSADGLYQAAFIKTL